MPTSGRPCASGSSRTMGPTGVTHVHGRMALVALEEGAELGAGTGGR